MNRRNFFSAMVSAIATFTFWPRKASALPASVDEIAKEIHRLSPKIKAYDLDAPAPTDGNRDVILELLENYVKGHSRRP